MNIRVLIGFLKVIASVVILFSCNKQSKDDLYTGFANPPQEAKPFVRWWWNGNRITEDEIIRQLDVLSDAGIGGVEINPIEFPEWGDTTGTRELVWLSPEWNQMLALASQEADKRGMITDLIVGSGWPFGGEFLKENELIQRVITGSISCSGGDLVAENIESLYEKALSMQSREPEGQPVSTDLLFITLIPEATGDSSEIMDLSEYFDSAGKLSFTVPQGDFNIIYGIIEKGHRQVMHGAPGAAGPVMDHYRKEITLAYLSRLKKISDDTGIPLSKLLRALFCDSIELAGANWTDDFEKIFNEEYGYDLKPWFPFIFYESYRGYENDKLSEDLFDHIKRVRYDYNKLLVRVFLDNFTQAFQDFCTDNGLLCRYQAYGTPFLMGMMEGNMIPDIPESNNWLYSVDMVTDEWIWNQDHGYMIWNLYASSGGHLKGRKIISCEAMTNTRGVFKTSLAEIKRHDDMNFITGINHTVLHGYNYSPAEAGFPGWIRFGAYFSEQNTWWPFFRKWTDYNSRLSFIFQNTSPVKNIAVMGPTGDVWGEHGLIRVPFHREPWYCYRLWEALSQAGSSCDYIDEKIITEAHKEMGLLKYGPMSFQALILCDVNSLEPQTAEAVAQFVESGGRVILAGSVPEHSLSYINTSLNDSSVKDTFRELLQKYPDRIFTVQEPENPADLLPWTINLIELIRINKDIDIIQPSRDLFQIRHNAGDKDIWFFVNSNLEKSIYTEVSFPTGNKLPWKWDPETGTREPYHFSEKPSVLNIELGPLESLLLVFEPGKAETHKTEDTRQPGDTLLVINGPWEARFDHHNGAVFSRTFEILKDFAVNDDPELNSFAGTVHYTAEFESDGNGSWLILPDVNKGVTELIINDKPAGINWYGKPLFKIGGLLNNGENKVEIKYTTILSNYVRSLKDNPTAVRWSAGYEIMPSGIDGSIVIMK